MPWITPGIVGMILMQKGRNQFAFYFSLLPHSRIPLKPRINIPRPTTFRGVAGNIFEFTLLLAAWTGIRPDLGRDQESAVAAFPVCQSTSRTNITGKFAR